MTLAGWLVWGIGSMLSAGFASLALGGLPRLADGLNRLLLTAGLLITIGVAGTVLLGGPPVAATVTPAVPGGRWMILVDPLAAWFLILLGLVGIAAVNYGIPYLGQERGHRSVATAHALASLLIAAMSLVLVAHSAVLFLIAWEIMAVSAYFLIMFESDQKDVRRAGLVYLILTHAGTLALIAMFLWWGRSAPDFSFDSLGVAAPGLAASGGLVLLLALAGFGGKAGVVPLHFWLPGAHAAAPSHVSALLSSVMLKIGIYGLVRVITMVGPGPLWFGWLLFGLGLLSGIFGVLWALGQHDLKRVLAYSSVENIGIIVMGIGVGTLGMGYHRPIVAGLGFAAALLHCLNHSFFKGLLFLGAGAIARETGTRMIDRMGGLSREMPLTAVGFAIGSIAIVGLPPLNGFVSEWALARAILHGAQTPAMLALVIVGLGGIGLIGALALACFARMGGALFLGNPRTPVVPGRDRAPLFVPMMGLALLCVLAGALPVLTVEPAIRIARTITRYPAGDIGAAAFLDSAQTVTVLATLVLGLMLLIWLVRATLARTPEPRTSDTWGCGYPKPTARMQYTASSFGATVLRAFGPVAAPLETRPPRAFTTDPRDRVLEGIVIPLWRRIRAVAERIRPLQEGRITRYLQYMVLTVLLLLGAVYAATVRQP